MSRSYSRFGWSFDSPYIPNEKELSPEEVEKIKTRRARLWKTKKFHLKSRGSGSVYKRNKNKKIRLAERSSDRQEKFERIANPSTQWWDWA